MPKPAAIPQRFSSSTGLNTAADAAGYSLAGFQDADEAAPANTGIGVFRFLLLLAPMVLAVSALFALAVNI